MATLGFTSAGGSSEAGWNGFIGWGRIGTATENGSIDTLHLYIDNATAGVNCKLAIYDENATNDGPGNLVAQTAEFSIANPTTAFVSDAATGSLVSGTTYWMAYKINNGTPHTFYDAGGLGFYEASQPYADAFPDPSSFTTTDTRKWSMYVTYTPSGGTTTRRYSLTLTGVG